MSDEPMKTVVVHSMGKVGSSSVLAGLKRYDNIQAFQTHILNSRDTLAGLSKRLALAGRTDVGHIADARSVLDLIDAGEKEIYFISLVRDPIRRNLSAFFENLFLYASGSEEAPELARLFVEKYQHSIPTNWFDQQVQKPLAINVFAKPFDPFQGKGEYVLNKFRLLVIRTEDPDYIKEMAIRTFLSLEDYSLVRANDTNEKEYAAKYLEVSSAIAFPNAFIDEIYSSKYMSHFYTPFEADVLKKAWRTR